MRISIDSSELAALGADVRASLPPLAHELEVLVARAAARQENLGKTLAPVYIGALANSIHDTGVVTTITDHVNVSDSVVIGAPHGIVVEDGRKPGAAGPPLAPIERWVRLRIRRGDLSVESKGGKRRAAEIRSLAFVIARKIHDEGIVGSQFFERAALVVESELAPEVERVLDQWARKMGL